jgi:hypothetical protein
VLSLEVGLVADDDSAELAKADVELPDVVGSAELDCAGALLLAELFGTFLEVEFEKLAGD